MFSPAELDKLVATVLPADAPRGAHVLVGTVNEHGAQVVVGFKLRDQWEVTGTLAHNWTGDTHAEAKVIWSW